jgi:hypothetical protein
VPGQTLIAELMGSAAVIPLHWGAKQKGMLQFCGVRRRRLGRRALHERDPESRSAIESISFAPANSDPPTGPTSILAGTSHCLRVTERGSRTCFS